MKNESRIFRFFFRNHKRSTKRKIGAALSGNQTKAAIRIRGERGQFSIGARRRLQRGEEFGPTGKNGV
ncbi:MAG: hypothetical protein ABI654_14315 [Betaproteobacteria bacterium]